MITPCPSPKDYCPYATKKRGCHADTHHLMWPKDDYRTPIERAYRELDINKVQVCRWLHDDIHLDQYPPKKPNLIKMLAQLDFEVEHAA